MRTNYSRVHGRSLCRLLVLCCVGIFFFATWSSAQIAGTANIQGTVTDATGAVIPNVTVTLTNVATQSKHITKTSSAGVYLFPGVHVGKYDLTAKATGFKTYIQKGSYRVVLPSPPATEREIVW